jgi:lysophospholipid acyltransferase (LPLAT)-like uncharacterized protein
VALSVSERLKIWLLSTLAYWVIRTLGSTLRWEVHGIEPYYAMVAEGRQLIGVFWHGRILAASYFFRNHGFVVMTSRHRDGDYIAAVIHRFGFGSARGSSSRGSKAALAEMLSYLSSGRNVAFTIDGPRGPRYVAKPGATWLAAKSACPMFPFNISAEKKWTLRSWDHFQIPKPFSRIVLLVGTPIYVKPDGDEDTLGAAQQELQRSLEDLLKRGDSYWNSRK